MNKDDALKLALEALESVEGVGTVIQWKGQWELCHEAINAIKEALDVPETNFGNIAAQPAPLPVQEQRLSFTTGHCKEKRKPGGCQLHNIHCGFPACDRKES
jgi:hypothetical protein